MTTLKTTAKFKEDSLQIEENDLNRLLVATSIVRRTTKLTIVKERLDICKIK